MKNLIEKIPHKTEEDLEIFVANNQLGFAVGIKDLDADEVFPSVRIFKSEETAKHYAEQLAGLIK